MPNEPTQVMSLDELMDLAAEPRETATTTIPATPMPAPLNPAAPRPTPAPQQAARTEPDIRERMIADAREWLRQGDNTLIAWTAAIACLLLLVVAAL